MAKQLLMVLRRVNEMWVTLLPPKVVKDWVIMEGPNGLSEGDLS